MVLAWIGIAVGILIILVLIVKTIKTPSHESFTINVRCKKCGYKTNGLKCPKCNTNTFFSEKYK
ncbi:hypothetical protein MnTg01_00209 [archaeon MnTg01]|nr:hypothetical protein MnTg01_00209 [archaeon MnTg01]